MSSALDGEVKAVPDGKSSTSMASAPVPRSSVDNGIVLPDDTTSGSQVAGGKDVPLKKDLGWIGIFAAGFNISNSWLVIAATLVVSLQYGPMNTIWGIIAITPIYLCIGLTLSELVSVYPTTGGQYHWTSILSPKPVKNILSYFCGFISWFSWLCMASSANGGTMLTIFALIMNSDASYVPTKWQSFLFFQATNVMCFLFNLVGKRFINSFYTFGFLLSVSAFLVFTVTGLAMAPKLQSSSVVWTTYYQMSGWSPGVQFLIALSAPVIAFCPLDGAVHLVEEVRDAPRVVPRTIMAALGISFLTSFAFALSALYSTTDIDGVMASPSGFVLFDIWMQATKQSVAVVFTIISLILLPIGVIACMQVASMMTWSLGRDGLLPFGSFLGRIHPVLNVPVWSLLWNFVVMFLLGILYLISDLAYNSIIGVSVILQQIVLLIPVALLIYHRRDATVMPRDRPFWLPEWAGWTCNIVTFCFTLVIPIFLLFPYVTPVSRPTMNYAVAVLGGLVLMSIANWFVVARTRYNGPTIEMYYH